MSVNVMGSYFGCLNSLNWLSMGTPVSPTIYVYECVSVKNKERGCDLNDDK